MSAYLALATHRWPLVALSPIVAVFIYLVAFVLIIRRKPDRVGGRGVKWAISLAGGLTVLGLLFMLTRYGLDVLAILVFGLPPVLLAIVVWSLLRRLSDRTKSQITPIPPRLQEEEE